MAVEFFDPHFHIWDLRPESVSGHDPAILHECPWNASGDAKLYGTRDYEADCDGASELVHIGGVFIDATSVCFPDLPGSSLQERCLQEARWVADALSRSARSYMLVGSACLEAPNSAETLAELANIPRLVGIRQILNHEPSWPRNAALGDLLDQESWQQGFARLADVGFSFDLQLNPHQFAKAAALIKCHPGIPVIINHLGTPTMADLTERSDQYWNGMGQLAALPHVSIKISMLCYIDKEWHQSQLVLDTVAKVIKLFGDDRCCFATNFPVDRKDGWPASRLYQAFVGLAQKLGLSQVQQAKLFRDNARRIYRVLP